MSTQGPSPVTRVPQSSLRGVRGAFRDGKGEAPRGNRNSVGRPD